MFYSKFLFVKKGGLSKVWIAAHFKKKLSKQVVLSTDICESANSILKPEASFALRLSGQLLLGLARIYQRKAAYLMEDCTGALTAMKIWTKPGTIDLPPDAATVNQSAITYAENDGAREYQADIPLEDMDEMLEAAHMGYDLYDLDDFRVGADNTANQYQSQSTPGTFSQISASEHDITLDDNLMGDMDLLTVDGNMGLQIDDDFLGESLVSEVEVARAGAEQAQADFEEVNDDFGFDDGNLSLDRSGSFMQQDMSAMSALDASTLTQSGLGDEEVVKSKSRKRKTRNVNKRDERQEISSKKIMEALKDASDLIKRRECFPRSKRARYGNFADAGILSEMLARPVHGLYDMAPQLLEVYNNVVSCRTQLAPKSNVDESVSNVDVSAVENNHDDYRADQSAFADQFEFDPDESIGTMENADGGAPDDIVRIADDRSEFPGAEDSYVEQFHEGEDDIFDDIKEDAEGGDDVDVDESIDNDGWSQRTIKMAKLLSKAMKKNKSIPYESIVDGKSRKTAARVFYQLLVLKTHEVIDVQQEESYGEIEISNLQISKGLKKVII